MGKLHLRYICFQKRDLNLFPSDLKMDIGCHGLATLAGHGLATLAGHGLATLVGHALHIKIAALRKTDQ